MKNPTNTKALAGHLTQNSTASITDMHIVLQHLTDIMNGLTLKIQVGTILTLVMLASAATAGGCQNV
jgi:hypothetical protein